MTVASSRTPLPPAAPQAAARPADQLAQAAPRLAELDLAASHSVLFFGSSAQEALTRISDSMLERVRNKDLGAASAALNDMVTTLRGFDVAAGDAERRPGWLARLFGKAGGAAQLLQRYEQVRDQIELATGKLERHKTDLLIDIETLDRLYTANLEYFHELEGYIAAGETKLAEIDGQITAQAGHVAADTLAAQQLRDLRAVRDDLDRRLHDLRLTRQVTMQGLPGIRLVQDNGKALVGKIDSTLVNTVPLWRQQLARALTIQRARDAAASVAAANDLTNDLLRANAENLRAANRETREQIERGVFDVDAVADANRALIEAIEDSLEIAEQGRAARQQAQGELAALEQQLRASLAAAQARGRGAAAPDTSPKTQETQS
ncbi:MAG: toxic anion resistance protein [Gammaproteobacteria bacterium]|nr:toxic anion resistance protein [Gammaproteobacteria bacterium]